MVVPGLIGLTGWIAVLIGVVGWRLLILLLRKWPDTGEDHVWFEDRWMVASLCDE
jgi:hypothetical protein